MGNLPSFFFFLTYINKYYETYATPTPSRPYATAVLGMHYVKKQEIEKALKEYEDKIDIARDE